MEIKSYESNNDDGEIVNLGVIPNNDDQIVNLEVVLDRESERAKRIEKIIDSIPVKKSFSFIKQKPKSKKHWKH